MISLQNGKRRTTTLRLCYENFLDFVTKNKNLSKILSELYVFNQKFPKDFKCGIDLLKLYLFIISKMEKTPKNTYVLSLDAINYKLCKTNQNH